MLAGSIVLEGFQMVAWGRPKVGEQHGCLQHRQLAFRDIQDVGEPAAFAFLEYLLSICIGEALDHGEYYNASR